MDNPFLTTKPREERSVLVRAEQIKLAYTSLPTAILGALFVAAILVMVQWPVIEHTLLWGWFTSIALISGIRIWLAYAFKRAAPDPQESEPWGRIFQIITLFAGLAWGSTSILLFPADSIAHQVFLAFALAGIAAGGYTTLSAIWMDVAVFLVLCLLPTTLRFLLLGTVMSTAMAIMAFSFMIAVLVGARHIHKQLVKNIVLRIRIAETASLMQATLESTTDGILVVNNEGKTVNYNQRFATMWEIPEELLLSLDDARMLHHAQSLLTEPLNFMAKVRELYSQPEAFSEDVLELKDGRVFERYSQPQMIGKESVGRVWSFRDATEKRRSAQLIERQATHDILTDLPNRRLLLDRVTQALARCRRHGHLGAALFIDLDNFKNINDSLGHSTGDALLQEVARRLKKELREEDTSARLGGDEFVVLFSEVSDDPEKSAQQVQAGAEKIQKALLAPYTIHDHKLHVTASIGIALFPMEKESANNILRHADTAMYRAKEAGRNTIRFFLPSMQLAAEERLALQNDLRHAIKHNELHLHYQAQVDTSGNIIGAEALLRWQHPERGNVPPDDFVTAAEETGQILAIGKWVLENALGQLKAWTDKIPESSVLNLAVNVSPSQFRQEEFVLQIERILGETGADPNLLTLELTEGVLVENLVETIRKMEALKRLGVRFSIDDFGTGYSSLAYLKRLPMDEIKIDRSFVRDITTDPSDANLVEIIITMAERLGLAVVAEGVETEEQLDFLRDKGCRLFQGYYFSRPQTLEDFTELISKSITNTKDPSDIA